jgi:MerR family mercuric resistance operon transcriptional regulator
VQSPLTIGRLAKVAGVTVETIRYYQRRGLIAEPARPPGGQRKYGLHAMDQIAFIRRAQQLGFSLAEVQDLLQLAERKSTRMTRAIAERKVEFLQSQVTRLRSMIRRLSGLIAASRRSAPREPCPIIAELTRKETAHGRKRAA